MCATCRSATWRWSYWKSCCATRSAPAPAATWLQEQKFSERLLATLQRYHARAIETAQVIEELIQMAKDFQAALLREEALGLQPDEVAFYDALANNESAVRELGDDILKKIAVEITEKLRNSTSVDWQVRESVRAQAAQPGEAHPAAVEVPA